MGGTKALGFPQNGGQSVTGCHLVPHKFDLCFLLVGRRAEPLESRILQPFAVMEEFDLAVNHFQADGEGVSPCVSARERARKQLRRQNSQP